MKWYVKNADGKVFGPVDDAKLLDWVKDGRVEPFAGLSNDLKTWKLASLKPELEMDWLIENEPGQFYGPTHRAVVNDLLKSGSLGKACRLYRDDHGGATSAAQAAALAQKDSELKRKEQVAAAAAAEVKELGAKLQARDGALAARDRLVAEKTAEAAAASAKLAAKEAELTAKTAELKSAQAIVAAKESELKDVRAAVAAKDAEIAQLRASTSQYEKRLAKLTETKPREWKAEVVEPEVVSAEPPPASAREIFAPHRANSLADLERQAQNELARMGAAGAKRFFSAFKK